MPIHTDSSCMSGSMERVVAKRVHAAGSAAIVRAAGGRMFWMSAEDGRRVSPGSEILVEGSEHAALGSCCLRAVLAAPAGMGGDESLFAPAPGYDAAEEGARFDSEGLPLCPDCGKAMHWESAGSRDTETMGGYEVEYASCPRCGETWELVGGRKLYPTASARGRGRGRSAPPARTASPAVGVGARERKPGAALGRGPGGAEFALANWDADSRAEAESVLEGFAPHVGPAEQRHGSLYWTIDDTVPFEGDRGAAYASLVRLHEMLSSRGLVPSAFRDLRNWVSGTSM